MPYGKSQSAGQPCIGRTSAIHHGIVSASGVAAFFGGIVVAAIQFAGANILCNNLRVRPRLVTRGLA